jgi:hypothetical protein
MSSLTSTVWKSADWKSHAAERHAIAPVISVPDASEVSWMRQQAMIVRDTILVIAIQLVFRATMVMRRWNY